MLKVKGLLPLLWSFFSLLCVISQSKSQGDVQKETNNYILCKTSVAKLGVSPGISGNIYSENYPTSAPDSNKSQPECVFSLKACAQCKIRLSFVDLHLPPCKQSPNSICSPGCNYLFIEEPGYSSIRPPIYVYSSVHFTGFSFTTISNEILLKYCHSPINNGIMRKFNIKYDTLPKLIIESGSPDLYSVGHITSPNFPSQYARRSEIITYKLTNQNPHGFIHITFTDWVLSPASKITVIHHMSSDTNDTGFLPTSYAGGGRRPFVQSMGPAVTIIFNTGSDNLRFPYLGFRAEYKFVNDFKWDDRPQHVCGQLYTNEKGRQFGFDPSQCQTLNTVTAVDCVWVIFRAPHSTSVFLRLTNLLLPTGMESIEIRGGNSSIAPLLYKHSILSPSQNSIVKSYKSHLGFYVRLRILCSTLLPRSFSAVFVSSTNGLSSTCGEPFPFLCGNGNCIADSLKCDGVNHCGDYSDEADKNCKDAPSHCNLVCQSGRQNYCPYQRCNNIADCDDRSDELNCWLDSNRPTGPPSTDYHYRRWGIYIPIGIVSIAILIVGCFITSCFLRRKRMNRSRRQRLRSNNSRARLESTRRHLQSGNDRQQVHASDNRRTRLNISVEISQSDFPPTYEQSVRTPNNITSFLEVDSFVQNPPLYTPQVSDDPINHSSRVSYSLDDTENYQISTISNSTLDLPPSYSSINHTPLSASNPSLLSSPLSNSRLNSAQQSDSGISLSVDSVNTPQISDVNTITRDSQSSTDSNAFQTATTDAQTAGPSTLRCSTSDGLQEIGSLLPCNNSSNTYLQKDLLNASENTASEA